MPTTHHHDTRLSRRLEGSRSALSAPLDEKHLREVRAKTKKHKANLAKYLEEYKKLDAENWSKYYADRAAGKNPKIPNTIVPDSMRRFGVEGGRRRSRHATRRR